jgi:RNA polymerase-binding transcription factor DksA
LLKPNEKQEGRVTTVEKTMHMANQSRAALLRLRAVLSTTATELTLDERAFADPQELEGGILGDSADVANDLVAYELADRLHGEIESRLVDVDEALDRLQKGTYGRCLDCGELIDRARLHALPTAKRCLDCQRHLETLSISPARVRGPRR